MKPGPISEPPYVLTLTIIDGKTLDAGRIVDDSNVRICVRDPDQNLTHPNVVSVPTLRIPATLAEQLINTSDVTGQRNNTDIYKHSFVSNQIENGHNPVIFAVESLLSRKLGLSDFLEQNKIHFTASIAGMHRGIAQYPNQQSSEELQMVNLLVIISKGASLFPKTTASYTFSGAMSVKNFKIMWADGKDARLTGLPPEIAFGVCVDGLCILSTYDILCSEEKYT